jgi:hypothetical protein
MSAQELVRVVDLLANQVANWGPSRWAVRVEADGASRGDLMHALVQRLADLAADAEGAPRREVPRLENDLTLVDQLRVVAGDLVAAGASDLLTHAAAADVSAVRERLNEPVRP